MKSYPRNSCHSVRNPKMDVEEASRPNATGEMESNRNGTKSNSIKLNKMSTEGRRNRPNKLSRNEDLPIGDERVSELYIFPNSNIVEFTDVLCDNKV